tara:strand:+ start:3053 stop:3496 length:444 start_codon:yes stop_codon:yes gene_type:complete
MTVTVPILGIKPYIEKKMDKFARVVVLKLDEAIKENNPVDSGRMAASWMIGKNDTSGRPKPPGNYSGTTPPTGSNYRPGTEKIGNIYSIHNNLPYAEPVCYGTNLPPSWGGQYRSRGNQVQEGWFELIAKNGETFANDLWNEISGED